MKRCFLIGSRQAGEEVWPALCQAVEEHVRAGLAGEFWVGQYGGFDRMAAACPAAQNSRPQTPPKAPTGLTGRAGQSMIKM